MKISRSDIPVVLIMQYLNIEYLMRYGDDAISGELNEIRTAIYSEMKKHVFPDDENFPDVLMIFCENFFKGNKQ